MVLHDKAEIDLEMDCDLFSQLIEGDQNNMYLNYIPIERTDQNFKFVHLTLRDYFASLHISRNITKGQSPGDKQLNLSHKILIRNYEPIINFLVDMCLDDPALQIALLGIVKRSSQTIEVGNAAAANAITILSYAKVVLSGQSFQSIKISGADLSNAVLDNVDFTKADLKGVSFNQAWLRNAKFDESDLDKTDFGQIVLSSDDY